MLEPAVGDSSKPSESAPAARVFLCHASGDKARVRELYQFLIKAGVDPWLDEEKLIPGQDWEAEIAKAVRTSDVVVVCLSLSSSTKAGFVQKEIRREIFVLHRGTRFPYRPEKLSIPVVPSSCRWCPYWEGQHAVGRD